MAAPDRSWRVRPETPADEGAVRAVLDAAFGQAEERDIVDGLRADGAVTLALVAEAAGEVVGSILFSPVTVADAASGLAGLGPMAVAPERQRQGIGGGLIEAGLAALRDRGFDGVVVLGHAEYYPRFGFRPASRNGLRCVYPVPNEVFMARALRPDGLDGYHGLVRYHPAFGGATA